MLIGFTWPLPAKQLGNLCDSVKVVFLTGFSDDSVLQRIKEVNPDGYILKPFCDEDIRVAFELAYSHQPACNIR
jgi:AmiR/NasT family two-component response regulator